MLLPLVLWASTLIFVLVSSQKAGPQVETSRGLVVGLNMDHTTTTGVEYFSFRGIPYGEQPKRFQLPQQKSPWSGPLYAQDYGLPCPQPGVNFSEDCLKLNVFTPQNSTSKSKFPVCVFIHGGAFSSGSSNKYGPDFLVGQGLIMVTFNYRLGPIGFLTLGSPTAPGNLGLHDALLALRWVQQEITAFGGDPSRVTVMGHSSGSITTNFILMSPLSFQGAPVVTQGITLAGSPLVDGPSMPVADAVTKAHQLAQLLNCDFPTNDTATITCLQAADIHHIVGNQSLLNLNIQDRARFNVVHFLPIPDNYSVSHTPFFNKSFEDLTRESAQRNIPIITGFCRDEGTFAIGKHGFWKLAESNLDSFIPSSVASRLNETGRQNAVNKIRNHYFPDSPDLNKIASLVRLFSDTVIIRGTIKTANYYRNSTYAFIFDFEGSWRWKLDYFSQFKLIVLGHGAELPYIWYFEEMFKYFDDCKDNLESMKVKNIMVQLIANFIKTGTPSNGSVPWKVLADSNQYLVINSELSTVNASEVEREHYNVWADIEGLIGAKSP